METCEYVTSEFERGAICDPPTELAYQPEWTERVKALAPFLPYGPEYSRGIVESLLDMSRCVREGYSVIGYDYLVAAERVAARHAECQAARDARANVTDVTTEPIASR